MSGLLQELDRAIERGWANGGHLAFIRELAAAAYAAPPAAAPRVERYGDGVLVHWPEGVEQYVCVGDCVTGNLGAMAVPADDKPGPDWKYLCLHRAEVMGRWAARAVELGYEGVNDALESLAQQPAAAVPAEASEDEVDALTKRFKAAARKDLGPFASFADAESHAREALRWRDETRPQQPAAAVPEVVGWLHELVWDDDTSYSYHASEPRPIPPTPGLVSQRIGRAAMLAAAARKGVGDEA